jgi:hypothetical protein
MIIAFIPQSPAAANVTVVSLSVTGEIRWTLASMLRSSSPSSTRERLPCRRNTYLVSIWAKHVIN